MDEVDAFLDVVAARLKMRSHLTPDEVRAIAFRRAPVDQGYDTHEVDSFVDEVEATLAGNRRTTPRRWRIAVPDTPRADHRLLHLRRGNRNRAAVVSLGASVLGFSLVGALCGMVSGVIALLQIRHTHQGGRALAVAGLVISAAWVVVIVTWLVE
jgi:DivIVA domain-containing protein